MIPGYPSGPEFRSMKTRLIVFHTGGVKTAQMAAPSTLRL